MVKQGDRNLSTYLKSLIFCGIIAGALCVSGGFAARAETPVDLELLFAVDVSDSIDRREARLQRNGYIAALTDPAVLRAAAGGPLGRIAISYVEWAGAGHYRVLVDWTVLDGPESGRAIAERLAAAPLAVSPRTSISAAVARSVRRFEGNGFTGTRRIIDVSGDGPNNQGVLVTEARDDAVAAGVTINALAILPDPNEPEDRGGLRTLDLYYEDCLIGGAGAFVLVAEGRAAFAEAIRRKLIMEIAGIEAPAVRLQRVAGRERPSCNIGEWMWFGPTR